MLLVVWWIFFSNKVRTPDFKRSFFRKINLLPLTKQFLTESYSNRLNMVIQILNIRIQSEYGKIRTRKNSECGQFSRTGDFST